MIRQGKAQEEDKGGDKAKAKGKEPEKGGGEKAKVKVEKGGGDKATGDEAKGAEKGDKGKARWRKAAAMRPRVAATRQSLNRRRSLSHRRMRRRRDPNKKN